MFLSKWGIGGALKVWLHDCLQVIDDDLKETFKTGIVFRQGQNLFEMLLNLLLETSSSRVHVVVFDNSICQ